MRPSLRLSGVHHWPGGFHLKGDIANCLEGTLKRWPQLLAQARPLDAGDIAPYKIYVPASGAHRSRSCPISAAGAYSHTPARTGRTDGSLAQQRQSTQ